MRAGALTEGGGHRLQHAHPLHSGVLGGVYSDINSMPLKTGARGAVQTSGTDYKDGQDSTPKFQNSSPDGVESIGGIIGVPHKCIKVRGDAVRTLEEEEEEEEEREMLEQVLALSLTSLAEEERRRRAREQEAEACFDGVFAAHASASPWAAAFNPSPSEPLSLPQACYYDYSLATNCSTSSPSCAVSTSSRTVSHETTAAVAAAVSGMHDASMFIILCISNMQQGSRQDGCVSTEVGSICLAT